MSTDNSPKRRFRPILSRRNSNTDLLDSSDSHSTTVQRQRSASTDVYLNILQPQKILVKSNSYNKFHMYKNESCVHRVMGVYYKLPRLYRTLLILLGCVSLVAFLAYIITTRIVLYLSTGSMFYHAYDWYSYSNAAQRLYHTAGVYNSSSELCYTVDNQYKVLTANHVMHQDTIDTYILIHPVDFDLFPYLWDTILLPDMNQPVDKSSSAIHIVNVDNSQWIHNINKCNVYVGDYNNYNSDTLPSYCYRKVHHDNVLYTFQVITLNMPAKLLQSIQRVIIIGDVFEPRTYESLWQSYTNLQVSVPDTLSIGLISLSDEGCNNQWVTNDGIDWPAKHLHHTLGKYTSLLAHSYGDCVLSQVIPLYMQWPLGPSTRHSFPSYLNPATSKSIHQRDVLLNMQTTYNPTKPTRMQAWMVAKDYCNNLSSIQQYSHLSCYVYTNDLLFKIASAIDDTIGTNLHNYYPFTDSLLTEYLVLLYNSRYTICPAGKNPYEQYRIYESLMTGSIPIIERIPLDQQHIHPQSTKFRCTDNDAFAIFRKLDAPLLYVSEWNELPDLLNNITDQQAQQLQTQLIQFYDKFVIYLRHTLLDNIRNM